jgi:cell division initiation protein
MADELSPAYLREGVEFSVKLRGYDLEQVDQFLDRVADLMESLQQQLRQTTERAVRAEQLASDNAETDQALRRTLLIAQRTADEVIAEAEAVAERRREEAEATARAIIVAAEAEAARLASEAQRKLRDDIVTLESARDALQADVDALDRYLSEERDRLRRLADAQLAAAPAPPPTDVVVPPAPVVPDAPSIDDAVVIGTAEVIERDEPVPEPLDVVEVVDVVEVDDDDDRLDVDVPDDASALDVHAHDDEFLAELRKASDDDAPLGPRDDDEELFAGFGPLNGEHDLGLDRSRWGRRRRR